MLDFLESQDTFLTDVHREVHALVEELWNLDLGLSEETWSEYVGSLDDCENNFGGVLILTPLGTPLGFQIRHETVPGLARPKAKARATSTSAASAASALERASPHFSAVLHA